MFLACSIVCLLSGCASTTNDGTQDNIVILNNDNSVTTITDDQFTDIEVMRLLDNDPKLKDNANIKAVTMNENILLVGQAPSSILQNHAVELVKSLNYSGKIHNQIRIGNPIAYSTRSNDSWISSKLTLKLSKLDHFDDSQIKMITENSEVFLFGSASRELTEQTANLINTTPGVRKVIKIIEYTESS